LREEIEEDRSERKTDHGQLNKWKKSQLDALENHTRRKKRQVGEALKTRVNLT
jgi:hypothetical protein